MERGYVAVDDGLRTNVPGVFAIGDLTGKLALANVAFGSGHRGCRNHTAAETSRFDYEAMPRCTYLQAQVTSFSLTERRQSAATVSEPSSSFLANSKALALGKRDRFVKIVADEINGAILGAHLVEPDVTEPLPELVLARNWELTPRR